MPAFQIHIEGQVQGIGFRPFVYRLATRLDLCGWVSNQPDGVHIRVQGQEEQVLQEFLRLLPLEAPPLARIHALHATAVESNAAAGFWIVQEPATAAARTLVTPDLAICADCRQELHDPANRRYRYAFTTCTGCGPRYSILQALPYDRHHTTMAGFTMCEACLHEYHDPHNCRYFSQTNSCPQCPVTLTFFDEKGSLVSDDQQRIIATAAGLLHTGKIIAVKGIGGYLLMADATNAQAIQMLRQRKHRPAKPFALMYPSLHMAQRDVWLHEDEQALLLSPESPIVLAQKKAVLASGIQAELIAPGLNTLGIMLPYTPLFELLLSELKKPVIATSANLSGSGIIFRDNEALKQLPGIADYLLVHNRPICVPQDDSVVQLTPMHRQKLLLRRSRGYAPAFSVETASPQPVLALGADLKATFSFSASGNTFASQYLGDLSSFDSLQNFQHTLHHLAGLFRFQPSVVVTDMHPGYASVQFGKELAKTTEKPCLQVQHHEAHFAAVLSENHLHESSEPVLGIIWDGTGLGHDGLIRGGEFLLCHNRQITPLAQLDPYPHLLGDKLAREPRLAALALCHDLDLTNALLKPLFSSAEWKLYNAMLQADKPQLRTTSMGRVFDAVAALLGLSERQSFEGEAAMKLQALATEAAPHTGISSYKGWHFTGKNLPIRSILQQVVNDLQTATPKDQIAARFHLSLVEIIEAVAEHFSLRSLAFSGGVFQNSLLVDLILDKLSQRYQLYFHQQLPPNDECISFGQLAWVEMQRSTTATSGTSGATTEKVSANPAPANRAATPIVCA